MLSRPLFYRYIHDGREAQLLRAEEKVSDLDLRIKQSNSTIEDIRKAISKIEKEINERAATLSNLRDNLRLRRLKRDITAIEAEIASLDIEGAAQAKADFDREWA